MLSGPLRGSKFRPGALLALKSALSDGGLWIPLVHGTTPRDGLSETKPDRCSQRLCSWARRQVSDLAFEPIELRPEIRRDYPLNLSILISGGKETNKDSLSNGE